MRGKALARMGVFAALLAVLSQIALPLGSVPLTVQVFAVALCGRRLGKKEGVTAVAVWLLLGAFGAPVFYGFQGGIAHLFGVTGGFLWGFLPLAYFSAQKHPAWTLSGVAVCHLMGVLQFSFVSGNSIWLSFLQGSLLYLLKDILLALGAISLEKRLRR